MLLPRVTHELHVLHAMEHANSMHATAVVFDLQRLNIVSHRGWLSVQNMPCKCRVSWSKCRFPDSGMPARVAQQLIRDARLLDANPR